jgi:peptidoglycan/xylan/chitin deacetylase (PgdA/CDA1 family)
MKTIRAAVKHAWLLLLCLSGALLWARRQLARQNAVVVLMFHRVLDDREWAATDSLPGMVITKRSFEALVRYLGRHAEVVSLAAARPHPGPGAKPRLALTFDDGWDDNARAAYPVAAASGLPLTIFICPGLMGRQQPFWPERALRASGVAARSESADQLIEGLKLLPRDAREGRLREMSVDHGTAPAVDRTMDWRTVQRLSDGGVTFGSHSYSHEILTQLGSYELIGDLKHSRLALQSALGSDCTLLSYPNGSSSPDVEDAARNAGYSMAVTTHESIWMSGSSPYRVPRVNIWEGKVTAPWGGFSRVAFEYAAYWRPFMTWVSEEEGARRLSRFLGVRSR